MEQPIPEVTDKDVERIIIRDFGNACLSQVMSLLQKYGKQGRNQSNNSRVRLAILKLANGEFACLSKYIEVAIQDFRDVLAMAEYPRYMKEIGFSVVDEEFERSIICDDWQQYHDWLERE